MSAYPARRISKSARLIVAAVCLSLALSACGAGTAAPRPSHIATDRRTTRPARPRRVKTGVVPLPKPANLRPFTRPQPGATGIWGAAGRRVHGFPAVYETRLVPPGGSQPAGLAWMDTRLLAARLYSGSESPGGGPYKYTAPIPKASARSLVAAFNGGFKMDAARGGYYTEGRMIDPLRPGAASLVIYSNGSVDVGAWGRDVRMTRRVVAVRQNLVPLVAGGRPTALARSSDWQVWGSTCGASSCAASVPGIEHQWRSAVGVTSDGALVYAQGPDLAPLQLADLLARAGVVRGMQLDINPDWPIFATYAPASKHGVATAYSGHRLTATIHGPGTFFDPSWARDFITMSAR